MERLGDEDLRRAVIAYRDALRSHQHRLNRLNVYPVPDGDTGTNMALTLESVVAEMEGSTDMASTCAAISHGSLMGARGNSGVILSQILRGLSNGLKDGATASSMAGALSAASEAAYKAVMEPVEGTILTVVREAAGAAQDAAGTGASLAEVLEKAGETARATLERTPEMLPVLAEAGVVDAGGAGLVLLIDAFLSVVDGRPVPEPEAVPAGAMTVAAEPDGDAVAHVSGDEGPRYEVMYFLEAPDEAVEAFKQAWAAIGTSIVVVGGDGLWNCHIHADDIGAAIEAGIEAGRPRQIRVTDLVEQVDHERCVREEQPVSVAAGDSGRGHVKTAVVAVGAGDGVAAIFRSLGVQEVVSGGRSMNPSTAEILAAVDATAADEVVVLPNDKNVVPVAQQVPALAGKPVRVIPTKGVAQGLAAMVAYDPDAGGDANCESMTEAAEHVTWGEVTHATRDATIAAGPVNEGDWLGLEGDEIVVVHPDLHAATTGLLERLVGDHHEVVTIIEGEGVDAAVTQKIRAWLGENRPNVEVEVHRGGQALSAYLLSAE